MQYPFNLFRKYVELASDSLTITCSLIVVMFDFASHRTHLPFIHKSSDEANPSSYNACVKSIKKEQR